MSVRLSRMERKTRTRAELIRAARVVFLRRGFHGASVDEIALVPGIGVRTATAIKDAVAVAATTGKTGPVITSINTATGEIEESG